MNYQAKFLVIILFFVPLYGVVPPQPDPSQNFSNDLMAPSEIVVHNRVLLKVTGTSITLYDVCRKMDLLFYRQYPEYVNNPVARYQFYKLGWRTILSSTIDEALIVADAEEKKVQVTDGDIREELELLFGPDVVFNIDRLGMTYEEAHGLLKKELIVRKMNGMMVRSKAIADVHPKAVRERYEEFLKANPAQDVWKYRVLTIRSEDAEKGQRIAGVALRLLEDQKTTVEEVPHRLHPHIEEGSVVTLSDLFERSDKELSLPHRAVLQTLKVGNHSGAIVQSTKNNEVNTRLFFLEGRERNEPPPFAEMMEKLQGELVQQAMVRFSGAYVEKLRAHYGITEEYLNAMIPEDFEPFSLR